MAHLPSADHGQGRDAAQAAAKLHGMAEALGVLRHRGPAERQRAADFAAEVLAREVQPADWRRAGLSALGPAGPAGGVSAGHQGISVSHPAALHLASTAMGLRCSGLPAAQRADLWIRLATLFSPVVTVGDPWLSRLRDRVLNARVEAEDTSGEVMDNLLAVYQRHARTEGRDAYLTSLARLNLAIACCQRGARADLAEAVRLCGQEIQARTERYGPAHPVTLVARSLHIRCLIAQAEAAKDQDERVRLARAAVGDADRVRAACDRLSGVISANATLMRRYQGHALLLLGDLERARACLRFALTFDTARNGNQEWPGSGPTHFLLARVHRALGDRSAALAHAKASCRLLAADMPGGPSRRGAEALLRELERGPDS